MSQDRKQKRIRYIIFACLVLIPFLTYLETEVAHLGGASLPLSGNVLVFSLINVNVLLLLLMVFLVLRNLVHLVFERRRRLLGSRLRTKLVLSFISMSLIPTALLFFMALQFVSTSMDYWFNTNVEQSLQESLDMSRAVYQETHIRVLRLGAAIAETIEERNGQRLEEGAMIGLFEKARALHELDGLELISPERKAVVRAVKPELTGQVEDSAANLMRRALGGEHGLTSVRSAGAGDLVRGLTPVEMRGGQEGQTWVLVTSLLIPKQRLDRMELISQGLQAYKQLMLFKAPVKTSVLVMLLIVTLLIVFCAIWFGFYVARGLTGPIGKLAEATKRVADGELDFVLEKDSADEMGTLVDSFNQMTRDLLAGKRQLEQTYLALKQSNQELDERRRYTEIILENVAAGVISIDSKGNVTTMNRFAADLLEVKKEDILGGNYRVLLSTAHQAVLEGFLAELQVSGRNSIQRPLRLTIGEDPLSLLLNITRLEDEDGQPLGFVLVFDNLTQLEKAQRMAAWREVARRIAHEVKNPLTPIQLSAQRLRKRYLGILADEGEVFDLCTRTIINQVDELKRLVSEFSSFARMPAVHPSRNNLAELVREAMVLYEEAHRHIVFRFVQEAEIPVFNFDWKQMKQVLLNLLDNAVAVLPGGGEIEIALALDLEQKIVIMEVRDNGPGVRDEDKTRLFEPYFSTKKTGTGLGLAIASTIISDHGGYVRVKDNEPQGAKFIVELPLR